jgi:hypothetical protein
MMIAAVAIASAMMSRSASPAAPGVEAAHRFTWLGSFQPSHVPYSRKLGDFTGGRLNFGFKLKGQVGPASHDEDVGQGLTW